METKNFNSINNFIYLIFGFIMGFMFCSTVINAHATEVNMITEYKLNQKEGYEFVCLYDSSTKQYKLIEYADDDAYFTDDIYYVNQPYMCNLYIWHGNVWEPVIYGIENYSVGENENLIYASSDLKNADGDIYFYKTNSIITNPIYHGISTELVQKIPSTVKLLIPIIIIIIASMIVVNLIPRILHKFF